MSKGKLGKIKNLVAFGNFQLLDQNGERLINSLLKQASLHGVKQCTLYPDSTIYDHGIFRGGFRNSTVYDRVGFEKFNEGTDSTKNPHSKGQIETMIGLRFSKEIASGQLKVGTLPPGNQSITDPTLWREIKNNDPEANVGVAFLGKLNEVIIPGYKDGVDSNHNVDQISKDLGFTPFPVDPLVVHTKAGDGSYNEAPLSTNMLLSNPYTPLAKKAVHTDILDYIEGLWHIASTSNNNRPAPFEVNASDRTLTAVEEARNEALEIYAKTGQLSFLGPNGVNKNTYEEHQDRMSHGRFEDVEFYIGPSSLDIENKSPGNNVSNLGASLLREKGEEKITERDR